MEFSISKRDFLRCLARTHAVADRKSSMPILSNILLAMGMHMLSPVVVSLPFKLLLFIMIDGWSLLARGLLQGYLVVP